MGVKFGMEERRGPKVPSAVKVSSAVPNFTPIGATCRPCGTKKNSKSASEYKCRLVALRAMLPVTNLVNIFRAINFSHF